MIYSLSGLQVTFIIIAGILLLSGLFILIGIPLIKSYKKKHFKDICYKKINSIVLNNDYYLINNFTFRIDNYTDGIINHLVFGDKYIYIITTAYYDGDLTGKQSDKSLIYVPKKGVKQYTDNPILANKKLLTRLVYLSAIDQTLFVGIVVINDDCTPSIESDSKLFYIVQRNKLPDLIKAIESRGIGPINKEELQKAVKALAKANKRK